MKLYITDIKEISAKKVLIFVNDAPLFALYKNEPEKLCLKPDVFFEPKLKERIYSEILYKRALKRSLGLLRVRDYTVYEITDKLKREYYPEEIISEVIGEMQSRGFVNDRRYTESYIDLYSSNKSRLIIKQNLLKKGVSKEIIEEEMKKYSQDNPDSEDELILRLLETKYRRDVTFTDEKDKYKFMAKVYSFLQRKGFSYDKSDNAIKSFFDS